LNDLLGDRRISENSPGQTIDGTGVAPVGLSERVLPPATYRDDERGVARVL